MKCYRYILFYFLILGSVNRTNTMDIDYQYIAKMITANSSEMEFLLYLQPNYANRSNEEHLKWCIAYSQFELMSGLCMFFFSSKDSIPYMLYAGHQACASYSENVIIPTFFNNFEQSISMRYSTINAALFIATKAIVSYASEQSPLLFAHPEALYIGNLLMGFGWKGIFLNKLFSFKSILLKLLPEEYKSKATFTLDCIHSIQHIKITIFITAMILACLGLKSKEKRLALFDFNNIALIACAHNVYHYLIRYDSENFANFEKNLKENIKKGQSFNTKTITHFLSRLILRRLALNFIPIGTTILYTALTR